MKTVNGTAATAAIRLALLLVLTLGVRDTISQIVPGEGMDSGLGGSNIISGNVYTAGGRLSKRVTIRLTTMTRGDRVASTDENGSFVFRGIPSGSYTIIIDKEREFEPFSQAVEIIQLRGSPPTTITLSIRLEPKGGTISKPAVVDAGLAALPERAKEMFANIQTLEKLPDHKAAIEQLLLLTGEFPNFMLGFNELGVEYLRISEPEKADPAFETAMKLAPDAFAPKLNRGIALVTQKKYAEAEPILRAARAQNDQSGPVRYFLGTALANLGKFDEAAKELSAAISMGGNEMAEAHRILAIIYSSKGDKKRAADEIDTYLKINPTAPDAEQLKKAREQLSQPKQSGP